MPSDLDALRDLMTRRKTGPGFLVPDSVLNETIRIMNGQGADAAVKYFNEMIQSCARVSMKETQP